MVFLCVLMLCTFYFDVVTAACQLLVKGYVMLCYVNVGSRPSDHYFRSVCWFVYLCVCLFVQSFSQPSLIRFRSN